MLKRNANAVSAFDFFVCALLFVCEFRGLHWQFLYFVSSQRLG